MKIAIASSGNSSESVISMFFARCEYFAIYDTNTTILKFVENKYRKKRNMWELRLQISL